MLYIILPIYNEEKSIAVLLKKINKILKAANEPFQIIGLDDGSHDQTAEILNDLQDKIPLKIIAHKINRGLGETARDLFEYAASISQPNDIIIRMDADNTHEPKYISPMISKIKHGYDVVIASRFKKGGGMIGVSKYRSIVSYGANLLMKIFFPIKGVQEYSCGFRAYRASTIKTAIKIFGNDYDTRDGTCIRDYIDLNDLIDAHFKSLSLEGEHTINIGTGDGFTVKECIEAVNKVTDVKINTEIVNRRDGDPECLLASNDLAYQLLSWKPVHSLEESINSMWNVYKKIYE